MALAGGESGAVADIKIKMEQHPGASNNSDWKPPVFNNTYDDIQKYFRQFKRVSRANGWSEVRQLSVLPALFTEEAEWVADELEQAAPGTVEEAEKIAVWLLCPNEKRKLKLHQFYEARLLESDDPRRFT